jgi:hypothetical protein
MKKISRGARKHLLSLVRPQAVLLPEETAFLLRMLEASYGRYIQHSGPILAALEAVLGNGL